MRKLLILFFLFYSTQGISQISVREMNEAYIDMTQMQGEATWDIVKNIHQRATYRASNGNELKKEVTIVAQNNSDQYYLTSLAIKISESELLFLCVGPKKSEQFIEISIMALKNGVVYELDYGIAKLFNFPNDYGMFLQKAVLNDGSAVIIKDRYWLYSFAISGDENNGIIYVPPYTFLE